MTHNVEKAKTYIGKLDVARCNGSWDQVPEWVRKVSKHAPQRTCLVLTANTELLAIKRIRRMSSSRPPSSSRPQTSELAQLIPPLLRAIETKSQPTEDIFQCQTCLAWIHWLVPEPELAALRLPNDVLTVVSEIAKPPNLPSDYTILCMLRSTYIKARCREEQNDMSGSLQVFASIIPWMHKYQDKLLSQPYFISLSEQLCAHMALTASEAFDVDSPDLDQFLDSALQAFRHWTIFSMRSKDPGNDDYGIAKPTTRRKIEIWKAYYRFLSKLLQHGIDHHVQGEKHSRLHQVAELKRVESSYGSHLLQNTKFPRAEESNEVIEDWVEEVIANWETLCERPWPEVDLGEGGLKAVGRNVLDLLYQAATKTFCSALILRRLFQVHKSVGDIDLAYRALNSYLDHTTGDNRRDRNSRQALVRAENHSTIWGTVTEAIEGLCMSGREVEAEKAFELTLKLNRWIESYGLERLDLQNNKVVGSGSNENILADRVVNVQTLETVYRAIGIGTAFWAAWTPEIERRSTYQGAALANLNLASTASVLSEMQPLMETVYAKALLLAEIRDLNQALDSAMTVLSSSGPHAAEHDFARQRRLIPFWHLLSLLLSARQDYEDAHRICRTVLDQFTEADLPVSSAAASSVGSSDVIEKKVPAPTEPYGLCENMTGREKEGLIEIKMTELGLLEILESAEEAVNCCNEMLSLCSMFSRQLGISSNRNPQGQRQASPHNSSGTVKRFRERLFGRRPHHSEVSSKPAIAGETLSQPGGEHSWQSRPAAEAPSIQITEEDRRTVRGHSLRFRRSHSQIRRDAGRRKLHKKSAPDMNWQRNHGKLDAPRPASSLFSSRRQSLESDQEHFAGDEPSRDERPTSGAQEGIPLETDAANMAEKIIAANTSPLGDHNEDVEAKASLPLMAHNMPHAGVPPPAGHEDQPPQQDVRLPTVHATKASTQLSTQFPRIPEQVHAHRVLVKVWLFVAGLYRRASLFEDSKEACEEAQKSASQVEALVAAQESSAAAFSDAGWDGGRSSNQLQADIHVERAYLAASQGLPHEARQQFEEALMYSMDHAKATVGLCNLLLDTFEGQIPLEPPAPDSQSRALALNESQPSQSSSSSSFPPVANQQKKNPSTGPPNDTVPSSFPPPLLLSGDESRKREEHQDRLAARDRAYGLLSHLTRLSSAWDDSEAWYALARAHRCSEQTDREREVLEWCVELEQTRPVRHWRNIGHGSYVL